MIELQKVLRSLFWFREADKIVLRNAGLNGECIAL